MIKDPDVAKQIDEAMRQMWNQLCGCLDMVRERCSPEEHAAFVKATRNIGCGIVMDVMEPLYEANPNLKPPNWDEGLEGGTGFCKLEPKS